MTFADNLAALPTIDHLAAIEVLDADGTVVDTVENKPESPARSRCTTISLRSTAR